MHGSSTEIKTSVLHHLWSVVEGMHSSTLLQLNDGELVHKLLSQMKDQMSLDSEELMACHSYLCKKIPLIRDMALTRLMHCPA
jgi:hypothetical protein